MSSTRDGDYEEAAARDDDGQAEDRATRKRALPYGCSARSSVGHVDSRVRTGVMFPVCVSSRVEKNTSFLYYNSGACFHQRRRVRICASRGIAKRPGTVVYDVEHDSVTDPWPVVQLRAVFRSIAERVSTFGADADDFAVRKGVSIAQRFSPSSTAPAPVLDTHRPHVGQYANVRDAMRRMLEVRDKVERGRLVTSAKEADALATREVTRCTHVVVVRSRAVQRPRTICPP